MNMKRMIEKKEQDSKLNYTLASTYKQIHNIRRELMACNYPVIGVN